LDLKLGILGWVISIVMVAMAVVGCAPPVATVMAVCPQVLCPAAITNVLNNGVLRSGFVVGTGGSSGVEVSLDGGAFVQATGTTNWSFQLPTGTATWRESSQHTITVRAAIEGAGSSTITVRKGVNLDINGDGYPDTVVGTGDLGGLSNNNMVSIFLSSGAAALPTTPTSTIVGPAPAGSFYFGYAVGLGDIDGDGYADLAVGAYQAGQVYVFRSSGSGGIPGGSATALADTTLNGGGNFGCALAVADVDGDGYADIAVGANTAFTVSMFLSTHASTGIVNSAAVSTVNGGNPSALPILLADLNGDGSADLIMSDGGNSTTDIFMSTPGVGPAGGSSPTATLAVVGTFAAGDVNGDGFNDLVVGNGGGSATYVLLSPGSAGPSGAIAAGSAQIILTGAGSDGFGSGVTVGDFNGDGFADVAVGTPTPGLVYVFQSTGGSPIATSTFTATGVVSFTGTAAENFGAPMAAADINGDGYPDLIVANLGLNTNQGEIVYYLSGGSGGMSGSLVGTVVPGQTASTFGWSLPY
jgi:FG-GAP-like repeat/FG-GAP repeat